MKKQVGSLFIKIPRSDLRAFVRHQISHARLNQSKDKMQSMKRDNWAPRNQFREQTTALIKNNPWFKEKGIEVIFEPLMRPLMFFAALAWSDGRKTIVIDLVFKSDYICFEEKIPKHSIALKQRLVELYNLAHLDLHEVAHFDERRQRINEESIVAAIKEAVEKIDQLAVV